MNIDQLESIAQNKGISPLSIYTELRNPIVFKRGGHSFTFQHKETNNLFCEIVKISWDEEGCPLFVESCLFFEGDFNECSSYFAAGTTKQLEKLSNWVKSL